MNLNAPIALSTFNTNTETGARGAQGVLRTAGFYKGIVDGVWGPLSRAAAALYNAAVGEPHQSRVFQGTNGYRFSTFIDGDDLCATSVRATCFGGPTDPEDNGITASGWNQRHHPDALIVSLPMTYDGACHGSPWGHFLGWGTEVQVNEAGKAGAKVFSGTLEDVGPAAWSGNAIDLGNVIARAVSEAAGFEHFNPNGFAMLVDVRVVGAAKRILTGVQGT